LAENARGEDGVCERVGGFDLDLEDDGYLAHMSRRPSRSVNVSV